MGQSVGALTSCGQRLFAAFLALSWCLLPVAAVGKLCLEDEKVAKLVENTSQILQYGTTTYYCMFTEHSIRIPIPVDQLTCSLDYEVRKKPACCEGYHAVGSECSPTCRFECVFGHCAGPDACECYGGYRKVDDHRCEPICAVPCEHGRCVAPDVCLCEEGYQREAVSGLCRRKCERVCRFGRCVDDVCQCDEGYRPDPVDGDACVPQCDEPCHDGICVLPNVCQCAAGQWWSPIGHKNSLHITFIQPTGYTISTESKFICEPVCADGCVNGNCTGPNECRCLEGYEQDATDHCVPVCEPSCQGGHCVAPGRCSCTEGYSVSMENGFACVPTCANPCQNGDCVAPNTCVCRHGYRVQDAGSPHVCVPACAAGCANGQCVEPGVCQCADGFAFNDTLGICQPHCQQPCANGACIGANRCQCSDGYQLDPKTTNKCVPRCPKACVHGVCVAPGVCECKKGYVKSENSRTVCEPQCPKGCSNGRCVAPDHCECLKGYFATTSSINSKVSICTPYCRNKCLNAYCIRPNVCQCLAGYRFVANSSNVCEPICDELVVDCAHGRCTQPNVCECNEGYSLGIRNGRMICEPVACGERCVNGYCVEEGRCDCHPGYRQSKHYATICEPVCDGGCPDGVCIAPNACVCNEGFEQDRSGRCQPICDPAVVDCYNGACFGSNRCQCFEGYYLRAPATGGPMECVPVCAGGCTNGRCVAPNECFCDEGYEFRTETNRCEPVCFPECLNGLCVEPNVCKCLEGYLPAEVASQEQPLNECVPHCDPAVVDCSYGICGGPNACRCFDDFYSTADPVTGAQTCEPVREPSECGESVAVPFSQECVCEKSTPCPTVICQPEASSEVVPVCNATCPSVPPTTPCPEVVCPTVAPIRPASCPAVVPCPERNCRNPAPPLCSTWPPPEPLCDELYVNCTYGDCMEQNVCSCHYGYELAISSESVVHCQPVCTGGCGAHGVCVNPEECVCLSGYNPTIDGLCEPFCENGCDLDAYCAEPNKCQCRDGFWQDVEGTCRRKCILECVDGECVDGQCFCHEGSVLRGGHICVELAGWQVYDGKDDLEVVVPQVAKVVPRWQIYDEQDASGDCAAESQQDCAEGFEFVAETKKCIPAILISGGNCLVSGQTLSEPGSSSELDETFARIENAELLVPVQTAESGFLSSIDRDQWILIAVIVCCAIVVVTVAVLMSKHMKRRNTRETTID
ncbi:LOW QUALITY PROTEIN: fibrillin-2-like [Anopheles cruzii]|uniref:LOW QUALITY PROTEIN: fibrillin-2-like n=1 Tax=Anopheles cruzii TaxID=68878 RepID=UPI0022EC7454|nr:LOW QUALITY PROTEIN: fibrillin-2-like [Anopheles cruzii]